MHPHDHAALASATGLGFTSHGTGPEHVLVLHDWLGAHETYDAVHPYLDGEYFTYVFADLRGYGHSLTLRGRYTIEEIASDCLALADRLGWQRFHLMGHSMTGMAAQRIAADAPARIKSIVATCPLAAAGNPLGEDALAFFASTRDDDDALRRLFRFVGGDLGESWGNAKLRQQRRSVARECVHGYLRMFTTTHFLEDVRGLATPMLVIIGDKDPGLGEEAMKATYLAWHPGAQLVIMPHCGHYPMQERPPYYAQCVEGFLREHAD